MKVLVTGAPGWLGTTLAKKLARDNRDVRCLVLKGMDTKPLEEVGVKDIVFGRPRQGQPKGPRGRR